MAIVVKLRDIVDAIDMPSDAEFQTYLDTATGEVVLVTDEDRNLVEGGEDLDLDDYPEWRREAIQQARLVYEHPKRFLALPDSFDVHEWDMMRRFCESVGDPDDRQELLDAVHGTGAFRMFRSTVSRLGLRDDWFAYRQRQFEQFAKDCLEENDIDFVEV